MRTVQVVLYREGDGHIAQCLDVDLLAGGRSEAEARAHLRVALELYFEEPASDVLYIPVTDARLEQFTIAADVPDPAGFQPASGGPCLQ